LPEDRAVSYADPRPSASRLTGLIVTVALHIVLIYALIHGLARQIVEAVRAPLETKIIEEIKAPPPDKAPPPPPPKLATPPPPFIPPPEVNIQVSVQQAPAITVVTSVAPPPAPLAPTPPPQVIQAQTIADSCEKPPYPAGSRRANEEGDVRVRLLIDVNGTVLESKIERSSGYRRLDQAAMEALLQCKYRPTTVGGRPERGWVTKVYAWRLRDAD
jgi:protein TonB